MSNGDIFVGEIIGTAILILFGAGVVRRRHPQVLQGEGRRLGRHRLRLGLRRAGRGVHRRAAVRRAPQPRRDPRRSPSTPGSGARSRSTSPGRWSARCSAPSCAGWCYYAQFQANAGARTERRSRRSGSSPPARDPQSRRQPGHRDHRDDRPGAADPGLRPERQRHRRPRRVRHHGSCIVCFRSGRRHRSVARRAHRLRHQPGP